MKFNDTVQRDLFRRALSRYALTFQGYILSVNCLCRILTRVRRTHSTSPVENSLITNPQEGEMASKNVNIQFNHDVSPAGLADELRAIKTAIMLLAAKLPAASQPSDICDSLRKMNSTKCNEMASLIEIAIDFND
ncbi:hypothetical protein IIM10_001927 [Escherichia coli]|nr:hypothetical protein [Escherichia coli]EFA4076166.1 hypothetical protein [Escherichia coli O96]EER2721278.1 hypothetical protein [Escherichia coli]EER7108797.1 hypothetical protein [Escherichia coli]EER9090502.1 hypothetical protein [Escherichia coli]